MPIPVSCPSCGHEYNVRDEAAGKKFKCKECEAIVNVPGGGGEANAGASDPFGDSFKNPDSGGPAAAADDPFSNLDFGGPATAPGPRPSQRRPSPQRATNQSSAVDRLAGPAIGMMITAGIGLLLTLGLGLLMVFALIAAPNGQQQDVIVGIAINGASLLFGTIMLILVMYGAFKMKNGESYGLALTASILASIPCLTPCICMPFGIWGIVVLCDNDVKATFP